MISDQGGVLEMSDGIIDFGWNGSVWRFWIQVKQYHEWTVRVSRGRRINVTLEEFDVAASLDGSCKEKYLMVIKSTFKFELILVVLW